MNKEKILAAKVNPAKDYNILSLSKILGKEIKDIHCMVDDSMSMGEPCISVSKVIFTDNTSLWFEGEHDYAYLVNGYDQDGVLGMKVLNEVIEDYYEEEA